jgi:hypothetical protein
MTPGKYLRPAAELLSSAQPLRAVMQSIYLRISAEQTISGEEDKNNAA